jgi:hypothetical protein
MLEELKALQPNDVITLSDEEAIDLTGVEELTVTGVKVYCLDDSELVTVELDEEFYIVVHNFQSDEKCFIYQLVDEGDMSDLESSGYKLLNEDEDFRYKIVNREDGKAHIFHHSETGAIYGATLTHNDGDADDREVSFCEYTSTSASLPLILIEREEDFTRISQGFEINRDGFEVSESE